MIHTIIKPPEFENDSALLQFKLLSKEFNPVLHFLDKYTLAKLEAFKNKNTNKQQFQKFKDRPSLRNYDKIQDLYGSIYTQTCEAENDFSGNYEYIIETIIKMISSQDGNLNQNRRCILRIVNNFDRYSLSEKLNYDVSCLSIIHYFKNQPRIVFRASDVDNEFFTDFITIYQFFIKPVYTNFNVQLLNIQFYLSTCQNITKLEKTIKEIHLHFTKNLF